ncbi:sensor histidine kinase [Paractinoplanes durhamensis]|uniref:histidine kinase n=1 Tax=Paractinoplanes durhamensis TaxID=113563 RepID=A0ABQ3Z0A4_9ACTN|nr:histidine kinase [Actinoplanes durhamensis]GIE03262.1 two-component sensor histidine kinase [Actinoplanes durhamensis]
METIGPPIRRNATGPLRRLLTRRETPRPPARRRLMAYVLPLGLLALAGLGLAADRYLADNRVLPGIVIGIIAAGSVLPVAFSYRLPIWAWRIAYPMMFLGVINAAPKEPWPWNTVQILGFLIVLGRLAVTQESGLTIWATALSLIPVFLFAKETNAWGAAVLLVVIAAIGDIIYRRGRTGELLAEKLAEEEELTELERAKRAVLEERTRIAREMHDVVAHHMSMIAVRAETAPYRLPELPADAREELAGIAVAARAALTDMRRLLGVLRAEQDSPEKAPQPGLADVDRLVTTAREAGVEVAYERTGIADLPGTAGLTAYRIVQEGLANAGRHAPGKPVTVAARGFADRLELTVRNELGEEPADAGGHGLIGMRERVTLLGGTLHAGPVDGEFVVHAVLPLEPRHDRAKRAS